VSPTAMNEDYNHRDFKDPEEFVFRSKRGLTRSTVEEISNVKNEPVWMRNFRLRAYDYFMDRPMPNWGGDLSSIDFDSTYYYAKPADKIGRDWKDVPENIKKAFEKLGIPEAERNFLGGVGAQYESEVVYHSLREDLEKKCLVFIDTDSAVIHIRI
jgi:Fe-S cluster assembly protein SufB